MKSEIRVKSSKFQFSIIIGLSIVALGTIAMMLFQYQMGVLIMVIAIVIGATGLVGSGLYLFRGIVKTHHELKMMALERQALDVKIMRDRTFLLVDRTQSAIHLERQELFLPAHNNNDERKQLMLSEPEPQPVDLLQAISVAERCLIVGVTDTGKTTFMQWIVWQKLQTSKVIVIDPHSFPGKWFDGAEVVGQGRNYKKIDMRLNQLLKLMNKRYDEIGRGLVGEKQHSPVTILIDEWRAITRAVGESASEAMKTLLSESRKVNFQVFVASQSERARPLGLEGEYDLKDSWAVVRLSLVDGKRKATLDTGSGERPAELPGKFHYISSNMIIDLPTYESDEERLIHEAALDVLDENGQVILNEISRKLGWSVGKYSNDKIKPVLAKFSMVEMDENP